MRADLAGASLSQANLAWANLAAANLPRANLRDASLRGANLSGTGLSADDLDITALTGANLSEANLIRADLARANLSGAQLPGANLSGAQLPGANLAAANLPRANVSRAYLRDADLAAADLRGADLSAANLIGANLFWANLRGADLSVANLFEAILLGTQVSTARFARAGFGYTVLGNCDLSEATGLDSVEHNGPSTIGVDTIIRSNGRIPESFLRGAGVPENIITQIPALAAVDYYQCFISYSSKDRAFAERLCADLRGKGVRCWFALEDMRIGDKIRETVDREIRVRDKLLVILSDNSVDSVWVADEVETALEEERNRKRLVLFPIRVDEGVMVSSKGWAAKLRQRHIGDFTGWKDHDSYQLAFDHLIRDLRAEDTQGESS